MITDCSPATSLMDLPTSRKFKTPSRRSGNLHPVEGIMVQPKDETNAEIEDQIAKSPTYELPLGMQAVSSREPRW